MEQANKDKTPHKIPKVYAFINPNKKVLESSSSGGAFFKIANYVIAQGGVVFGARFNKDGDVIHSYSDQVDGIINFMQSKYTQSKLGDVFKRCIIELKNGRLVLFTGTPCQVNALHAVLDANKIDKSSLISADVVCNGTPKAKIWHQYLSEMHYVAGQPINFRLKKPSWERYSIQIGKSVQLVSEDPYMWLFLNHYSIAESCFQCKCKGENREADITFGDFWGIRNIDCSSYGKKGTSLLIIRRRIPFFVEVFGSSKLVPFPYGLSVAQNPAYSCSVCAPSRYKECDVLLKTHSIRETAAMLGMPANVQMSKYRNIKEKAKACLTHVRYKIPRPRFLRNFRYRPIANLVGIVSDFGYENFGNKLQNFALKTILESRYKLKCENIVYTPNPAIRFPRFERVLAFLRGKNPSKETKKKLLRERCIRKASSQYEKNTIFRGLIKDERQLLRFQHIIFGSDQIWNFGYHKTDLAFNLGHVGILCSPIPMSSYAASMCQKEIPTALKPLFLDGLGFFRNISVREDETKAVLQKELSFDSSVSIDPTLLLAKEKWEDVISRFARCTVPGEPYVIVYMLGDERLPQNDQSDLPKGARVLEMLNNQDDYYVSNQFDFLRLIANSLCVYTNSFHAVVFSLIFQKECRYYPRQSLPGLSDRIISLLSLFGISAECTKERFIEIGKTPMNTPSFNRAYEASLSYFDSIFDPERHSK